MLEDEFWTWDEHMHDKMVNRAWGIKRVKGVTRRLNFGILAHRQV